MGQYNHLSRPILDSDRSELNEEEKKKLFQKCILMVDMYVKSHIHNLDDAHNLRQEILLKALEAYDKSYHERGRFKAWVMTIAMNMVRDYYRKKQRGPYIILIGYEPLNLVYKSRPWSYFCKCDYVCEVLREVLMELTLPERELIQDRFYLCISLRRASEKRHISKSACSKRCQKILMKIQSKFRDRGIDGQFLIEL